MPNHLTGGRAQYAAILLLSASVLLTTAPILAGSPQPPPATSSAPTPGATPVLLGAVDHPTDPTAIVLRMSVGGGFMPVEYSLLETPIFTLYGNNALIFRPQPANSVFAGPGEAQPGLVWAVMTPAQVDALLSFALGAGGLLDAQELYIEPLVADAPSTTFTIHAGGVDKQVVIQALGIDDQGPDAAIRARFSRLSNVLDSFEEQVAQGNVESADFYHPTAYRGMLTDVWEGVTGTSITWPWTDVSIDDFVGPDGNIARYAALTPEQVAVVTAEPSGGIASILVKAPDGTRIFLSIRPLLPEETFLPDGITIN